MTIAERIVEALDKAGKTRADLARHLGTQQSTVAGWVNAGRIPSSDAIVPICEFTGVSPLWLLTGVEPQPIDLPADQRELLSLYAQLDDAGKTIVRAKAIEESRRGNI